jgi:hypothetical protein
MDKVIKTCLSIDCPERTGGKCTASALVSGECARCKHGALLYPAKNKAGDIVGLCYECREIIKRLAARK